jgi:hypothetical protein
MILLGKSGAQGTLIHEKKMKSKISCQTPFNPSTLSLKYSDRECTLCARHALITFSPNLLCGFYCTPSVSPGSQWPSCKPSTSSSDRSHLTLREPLSRDILLSFGICTLFPKVPAFGCSAPAEALSCSSLAGASTC